MELSWCKHVTGNDVNECFMTAVLYIHVCGDVSDVSMHVASSVSPTALNVDSGSNTCVEIQQVWPSICKNSTMYNNNFAYTYRKYRYTHLR